jgi:hypothetical protein
MLESNTFIIEFIPKLRLNSKLRKSNIRNFIYRLDKNTKNLLRNFAASKATDSNLN